VRTIVKGKNIDVPESVREYAERKMRRLERLLDDDADVVVELSREQHRSALDSQIAEVTLSVSGQLLRGHAAGPTHQACLDMVVDRLERQAVDAHQKPRGKVRAEDATIRHGAEPEQDLAPARRETAPTNIVKTKRFAIEPMFEEDALARMDELGHHFFIFVNAETERLCVLYKRHAGDYGLIEPVVPGGYTPDQYGSRNGRD
jgi:putative sigma-54 modulation protein